MVSTATLAELRELEYGSWHDSWRSDGTHGDTSLLTLDALVALVLDWHRPVKIFIETKHPVRYGSLVETKLLALLHRFGIAAPASADRSRAVVMSFSAAAVWRIRRSAPMLPTVLLGKTGRYLTSSAATAVGATAVGPSLAALRDYPQLVDRSAAQGRSVYCWSVDEYADIDFCREVGVAWIATNHPGRTKAWLDDKSGCRKRRLLQVTARSMRGAAPTGTFSTSRATNVSNSNRLDPARSATRNRVRHQRHLFDLFLEEPLHELLAEVVALVARDRRQPADLVGDSTFLFEGQRQRFAWSVELVAHRVRARDLNAEVAVEQMLHQHHRVIAFLDRLAVKMLRQSRHNFAIEINRNRDVLLCRGEFVENLFLH